MINTLLPRTAAGLALAAALLPAHAATASLDSVRFTDVRTVQYQCAGGKSLSVRYFNSDDNHLALLRVQGKPLLFVTTVAASGARYVAQQYEWWTKGNEGTLRDTLQGEPGRGGAILLGECRTGK